MLISNIENGDENCFFENNINEIKVSAQTLDLIKDIISTVEEINFARNFIETSLEASSPSFILHRHEGVRCSVYFSYMIDNNTNIMFNRVKDLDFVIIQHVTSCDFVYFPTLNYLSSMAHFQPLSAHTVLSRLRDNSDISGKFKESTKINPKFKGFILSHGRPYHFFYDTVNGVQKLYEEGLIGVVPHYQMKTGAYIDFTKIYGLKVPNSVLTFNELNHISDDGNPIFFKVGYVFNKSKPRVVELVKRFDNILINSININNIIYHSYRQILDIKEQGGYLLWASISTEKRALLNQVDFIGKLLERFETKQKLCVVIDGWTSAHADESMKLKQIQSDLKVFAEISELYPEVQFFSTIGAESLKKVAIAMLIDFHISSAGTGSLWTSRIVKKPGVLHCSNAFRSNAIGGHLHYNSAYLPKDTIVDESSAGLRKDFVSYDLDINKALEFIQIKYADIIPIKLLI